MTKNRPSVKLGELLSSAGREQAVDASKEYRLLGIRLDGQGPFLRETVMGTQTSATKLFRVAKGDFIYSRLFACRGAFGVIGSELDGCYVSAEFPTFLPVKGKVDVEFLKYWFLLPNVIAKVDSDCSGSTPLTRNRFKENFFLELEIPLPPLSEQRRIVTRIEELAAQIHKARTLRHQAAEQADALISAQTSQFFEKLLQGEKRPIRALGRCGENPIQIGPFGAQLHKSEFVDDGIPVLNVGNVWPGGLRLDYLDYVTEQKAVQLRRYSIKTGDLLFARSGATLGKVCLVPPACDSWLMTGHLFRVRFDPDKVFNRFAFAALRGSLQIQQQVFGQIRGATRPGYNTTLLGAIELPVPPLQEQSRIVAELDDLQIQVDALKSLQSETATELDALLPAILDRAFKGEL
jgi:type I restriction enzyme S subunit